MRTAAPICRTCSLGCGRLDARHEDADDGGGSWVALGDIVAIIVANLATQVAGRNPDQQATSDIDEAAHV